MADELDGKLYTSVIVCDDVIRDKKSDNLTAIRITDAFIVQSYQYVPALASGQPDFASASISRLPVKFHIIVRFVSEVPHIFEMRIGGTTPSGRNLKVSEGAVKCRTAGGPYGQTYSIESTMNADEQGVHWIHVFVNDDLVSKAPILLVYGEKVHEAEEAKRLAWEASDLANA